jgi:nitrite reductase/ring-hydroxylating ferredoxin subunit
VLAVADLNENEPRRVEAGGVPVVLVRQGTRIFALADTCSHLGGPLSEGTLEDCSIRCPWHGSRFALDDGRVLDGPATNPQPHFDVRVRGGQIEVRVAQRPAPGEPQTAMDTPPPPVPPMSQMADDDSAPTIHA